MGPFAFEAWLCTPGWCVQCLGPVLSCSPSPGCWWLSVIVWILPNLLFKATGCQKSKNTVYWIAVRLLKHSAVISDLVRIVQVWAARHDPWYLIVKFNLIQVGIQGNTSTGVVKYYPFHRSDEPSVFINLQMLCRTDSQTQTEVFWTYATGRMFGCVPTMFATRGSWHRY